MGNDGGSIPARHELVKLKSAPKKVAEMAKENNVDAWTYCALSNELLSAPLVGDALGRLYNKDAIIKYMIDPRIFGASNAIVSHINTLKDVVDLQIAIGENTDWICPITRRDMNGLTKFFYLVPCGHVFANEALKNIETKECLLCSTPFTRQDVIALNPTNEDLVTLHERLVTLTENGVTHTGSPIKRKKRKAVKEAGDVEQEKVVKAPKKVVEEKEQSAVLKSLFHSTQSKAIREGFLTRGNFSRTVAG